MLSKLLKFYTRYFTVWVILCGLIAYIWPRSFTALEESMTWFFVGLVERFLPPALRLGKGMNWFFAVTMFGIGAVLQAEDFKRIARRPAIIALGSAAQFSIMPLGAFLFARLLALPDEIAVGLILTGSAPGAMASNVMSYVAKADTAYSVSLTAVSTLLCPLLTPGLTFLLAGSRLEIQFWAMVAQVIKMVLLPLLLGFAARHYFKRTVERVLDVFPAISVTFIVFICSVVIAANRPDLPQVTVLVLVAVVVLNLFGTAGGYTVGSLFRLNTPRRRALAIEIGMQNAGLGTILARDYISDKAALPAAVFVFTCIITASILAAVWRRNSADSQGS